MPFYYHSRQCERLPNQQRIKDCEQVLMKTGKVFKAVGRFCFKPQAIVKCWRWVFGTTVDRNTQFNADMLVHQIDNDNIDIVEPVLGADFYDNAMHSNRMSRLRFSFIAEAVNQCKISNPGINHESAANRMVAHRWLHAHFTARKMRPSHIMKMLPLAIEAVFIPNQYEVEALKMRNSRAFMDRLEQIDTEYVSRGPAWLFNWMGTRRSRPPVGPG